MPKLDVDAVVFDLLAALLDSWSLWDEIAGDPEAGRRWRLAYLRHTSSHGVYRDYAQMCREAAQDQGLAPELADELVRRWAEHRPWPEVAAVVPAIAARYPVAIATNCSRSLGAIAVSCTGCEFSAVVTAESAGYYKPHRAVYEAALAQLGTTPARTLFVGASFIDVSGAASMGMPVIWHNRLQLPPVEGIEPLATISTLDPLLDLLL